MNCCKELLQRGKEQVFAKTVDSGQFTRQQSTIQWITIRETMQVLWYPLDTLYRDLSHGD